MLHRCWQRQCKIQSDCLNKEIGKGLSILLATMGSKQYLFSCFFHLTPIKIVLTNLKGGRKSEDSDQPLTKT